MMAPGVLFSSRIFFGLLLKQAGESAKLSQHYHLFLLFALCRGVLIQPEKKSRDTRTIFTSKIFTPFRAPLRDGRAVDGQRAEEKQGAGGGTKPILCLLGYITIHLEHATQ